MTPTMLVSILIAVAAIASALVYINRPKFLPCMNCATLTKRADGLCSEACKETMIDLACDRLATRMTGKRTCDCWKTEIKPLATAVVLMLALGLAGSAHAQSLTEQPRTATLAFRVSQGALAGGVAINIVQSFRPHYDPIPTSFPILITGPKTVAADNRGPRTAGLAFGTVGMLGAEHFIVTKWPRSKKWLTVVNFGAGALAAGFAQR
jgi:hypothetical protein